MTAVERRNCRRRRERAAAKLNTPEGRALIAAELEAIEGARVAAKMITRATPDWRAVIVSAIDGYAESCAEYGFASGTARKFALQAAIFSTAAYQMLGDGFEAGARTMSGTRSAKGDTGRTATIHVAGFRDLAQLSAVFMTKAQIAIETAWRCEDRARLESKERERAAMRTAWATPPRPALHTATEPEPEDEQTESSSDSLAEDQDVAESLPLGHHEEHGAVDPKLGRLGSAADDLDEARDVMPEMHWCARRRRNVPPELVGVPMPGPGLGAHWVKLRDAEEALLRGFDEQLERARSASALKAFRFGR